MLPDVDLPADLPEAEVALAKGRSVSIIIPTLNEADNLTRLLPSCQAAQPLEILIADGGRTNTTAAVAAAHGARFIPSERGRARQMNTAAKKAHGEHLLFLHADTDPPPIFCQLITPAAVGRRRSRCGCVRFALREHVMGRALIEQLVALRFATRYLPYGDQCLFLRRSIFQAQGGFPTGPSSKDVHLVCQLRAIGRITITDEPAVTSTRRWEAGGVLRTLLGINSYCLAFTLDYHRSGSRSCASAPLKTSFEARGLQSSWHAEPSQDAFCRGG